MRGSTQSGRPKVSGNFWPRCAAENGQCPRANFSQTDWPCARSSRRKVEEKIFTRRSTFATGRFARSVALVAIDRRRAHWRPCEEPPRGGHSRIGTARPTRSRLRVRRARVASPPPARPARIFWQKRAALFLSWENPHPRASSRRRLLASSVRVRGVSSPRRRRRIAAGRPTRGAFRASSRGARATLDARAASADFQSIAPRAVLVLVAA